METNRLLEDKDPIDGQDVYTTLDLRIQDVLMLLWKNN